MYDFQFKTFVLENILYNKAAVLNVMKGVLLRREYMFTMGATFSIRIF